MQDDYTGYLRVDISPKTKGLLVCYAGDKNVLIALELNQVDTPEAMGMHGINNWCGEIARCDLTKEPKTTDSQTVTVEVLPARKWKRLFKGK